MRSRAAAEVASVIALFAATLGAFVVPWATLGDDGDALAVTRYSMFVDGHAALVRRTDDDGGIVEWQSTTVEIVPGFRALADLPTGFVAAVAEHVAGEGSGTSEALAANEELSRSRVGLVSRRILASDGAVRTEIEVQVLDRRGLYSLGFQTLGGEQAPTLFDPALPLLPADPAPGTTWSARGTAGALGYEIDAEITRAGHLETELGAQPDCISVSLALTLDLGDGLDETEQVDEYCADIGWVHGEVTGDDLRVYDTVSAAGAVATGLPDLPPTSPGDSSSPPSDPAAWQLSRVGSALPLSTTGKSTFAPVYIPSDPPIVLAATDAAGDLVALSAGGVAGGVAWRFPTGGAIYAQPFHDAATDRIYVGASDGIVRALDVRGMFLWSHATGDSVATRPVVAGGTLVFGSEDGHVYGVDADTGRRLWQVDADGAVVASPAVIDGLVVVADEAGTVRALDPSDGAVRWTWNAPSAVVAPLLASPDGVLVADTSGTLTLLDPGGSEAWTADVGRGSALLTQPALGQGIATTIDEQGDVAAVSSTSGDILWRRADEDYVGTAWTENVFVLARDRGTIDLVDASGALVAQHDARDASTPIDLPPSFTYGLSPGGGAVWAADDHGIVRRLGAMPENGRRPLEVAWVRTIVDPPYASLLLVSTPVAWGDRLVLVDPQRNLYVVDPTSGEAASAGSFGSPDDVLLPEALVVGDTMIVDTETRLMAINLATGEELWSVPLDGRRFHPPVVSGSTVVTVTADGTAASVQAVDLVTGMRLWQRPTCRAALNSGPVLGNGVVFVGDPVEALDLDTGEPRWTSTVSDPAGLPVLIEDLLLVTTFVEGDESGRLASIDAGTGRVRWERELVGEGHGPTSRLVSAGGVTVLTSLTGPILGIDPLTGDEIWRRELPRAIIGTPSSIGDRVWYALESGQVLALGPADGAIEREFEGFGTSIGAVSLIQRPVSSGDVVVIVAGPLVYAVREAGP